MAKSIKCNYKMCDNLGVAINPVKHINNRYYCKECLKKMLKEQQIRKEIIDEILLILPKEIMSVINKALNQWIEVGYTYEYMLYTVKYIRINKCVLNHTFGIRYYMNNKKIEEQYKNLVMQKKAKEVEEQKFEVTDDVVEFVPVQEQGNWGDLI